MTSVQIPKCIKATPAGGWTLRAQLATGQSNAVTVTFETLHEALAAYERATTARDLGQSVRDAIFERSAPTEPRPKQRAARTDHSTLTLGHIMDEYLAEREAIQSASDPTFRRSLKNGRNSLRPSTLHGDRREIRNHLRPRFGDTHPADITRAEVTRWMIELADNGIGTSFATRLFMLLRTLVGRAPASARPEDYPWAGCAAVRPANPRKTLPNPRIWGGLPGSAPPAITFAAGQELASKMWAAERIVVYFEHLGGPRIGETFGLQLGDFHYKRGRLWVNVTRQCLETNRLVPWVKTDAGYRGIPLPDILAEYVEMYVERYHGADLANLDDEQKTRQLVVNPAGRDLDGKFMPGVRSNFASRMTAIKSGTEFGYETLGYHLSSHHLRKSCSTYLLNARPILRFIANNTHNTENTDDLTPEQQIENLTRRLRDAELANPGYEPMHVSQFLGHRHNGQGDQSPASPVTLAHYNLSTTADEPFEAIADVIDRIARHELGDLLDEPDERDLLPVHPLNDPDWVTVEDAAQYLSMEDSNVIEHIHRGRLDGHLAWIADGGYQRNRCGNGKRPRPSVPRFLINRESLQHLAALRARPNIKQLHETLGMSNTAVRENFIETGKIAVERIGPRVVYDQAQGDALVNEILDGVHQVIAQHGPISERRLRTVFNKRHGHLFKQGRATDRWLAHWTQTLIDQGRAQRRTNKTLVAVPSAVPGRHVPTIGGDA